MATHFDAIVVGSGIGGLSFALNLARGGRSVAIVTKKTSSESNTNWAQGGIAAVLVVPLRHTVDQMAELMPTPGEGA